MTVFVCLKETKTDEEKLFPEMFKRIAKRQHEINVKHGFYEKPADDGTFIALVHSELSEALESIRHGNPPDDKIPEFSGVEAELADAILRIMDYSAYLGLKTGEAVVAKMKFNATRPYKHGGKKF